MLKAIEQLTEERLKAKREYSKRYRDSNLDLVLEREKRYRDTNKDRARERSKRWRDDKNATLKEYRKQYYEKNKDRKLESDKRWRWNNPDKVALYSRIRNTLLERQTPGWYEEDLVRQLYQERDALNEMYHLDLEVDHIIPLNSDTVSGLHCLANLQLINKSSNRSKGNRYQTD